MTSHTCRQGGRQSERSQTGWQTFRESDGRACRKTGRKRNRQAVVQADGQRSKHADGPRDKAHMQTAIDGKVADGLADGCRKDRRID